VVLSNCFQNIWFNKRKHPKEQRNGHRLSTKWVIGFWAAPIIYEVVPEKAVR